MDILAIKGDTEYYDLAAVRGNSPIDLTGVNAKIWFTAKLTEDDPDVDAVIALNSVDDPTQVVFIDRPTGTFFIQLVPADTADVAEDSLVYDVQVREHNGRITTVQRGNLYLKQDITRTVA